MPPRPKVNASGGVPQNTSSRCTLRIERGNVSHIATTSRWKCTVPFGLPVVPEVKAISATSSTAVGALVNHSGCLSDSSSSESGPPSYQNLMCCSEGQVEAAATSSASRRLSHSACDTSAFWITSTSSLARSSGIVATHTPPAFITANQQAATTGLLDPRSSTRLPGFGPISL